jgi:hypothetical protein
MEAPSDHMIPGFQAVEDHRILNEVDHHLNKEEIFQAEVEEDRLKYQEEGRRIPTCQAEEVLLHICIII